MTSGLHLNPVGTSFTLKDHIHRVLLDAILQVNIYDPDTNLRLDERQLAQQLGISRTPVREALARLEQDGFVEIQPRKGVFVCRKALKEILEMIIVWAALESMAARLVTQVATDSDLADLRKLAASYSGNAASAHIEEYSENNIKFHQRIIELSRCNMVRQVTDGLFLHMHAIRRRAMGERDRASHSVVDHMEIIEALESRDADLAERRVREHTMRLHDHIRDVWPDLFEY